jgi:hypothetical protein
MQRLSRRELLRLAAAALPALAPSTLSVARMPRAAADSDELDRWLAESLGGADLGALARDHAARFPAERTPAALRRAILAGRRPSDSIAAHVGRAVRADFAAGRVVVLGGWHLARTEARLIALAAFHRGGES